MFCFPPAGSVFTPFAALERAAGSWADCVTVQLPGRGQRTGEQPVGSFAELIAELARVISIAIADSPVPYVLLGHSLGAIAAYEVAALLETAAARPPLRVVVTSANPPQAAARHPGPAGSLDPRAFLRRAGAPDELFASAELLELTLRALDADQKLLRSYRFSGLVLSVPLAVLYGSGDDLIDRRGLAAWTGLSTTGVIIREYPGGHRFPDACYAGLLSELRLAAAVSRR